MDQKLKSEATQKLILECAYSLFYKNGYKATSIADIVKQARLSKGAFYHHFKDKKEVGEKTIVHILREKIYAVMITPLSNNQPIIPLLTNLFQQKINELTTEEHKWGCPLNNLINEMGCEEQTFKIQLKQIIEDWKMALIDKLEIAKNDNEISDTVNTTAAAIQIITAFEGVRGIRKIYDNNEILNDYLAGLTAYLNSLK